MSERRGRTDLSTNSGGGRRPDPSSKEVLRTLLRRRRRALSEEAYVGKSAQIRERLLEVPELEAAGTVHAFWPHAAEREVDLRPLLDALYASGKQIVLPVVQIFGPVEGTVEGTVARLRHARYEGSTRLRPNRWGILEPTGPETVPEEEIDVVLVPALGADRAGNRLGFGLGYYDQWLARIPARTVCPLYAMCLLDAIPAEPHDIPVQTLVTEHEILRPGVA